MASLHRSRTGPGMGTAVGPGEMVYCILCTLQLELYLYQFPYSGIPGPIPGPDPVQVLSEEAIMQSLL